MSSATYSVFPVQVPRMRADLMRPFGLQEVSKRDGGRILLRMSLKFNSSTQLRTAFLIFRVITVSKSG